eukprot:scpid17106/ scgid17854/ 
MRPMVQLVECLTPAVNNCVFRNNRATPLAIYKSSSVFITDTVFEDNIAVASYVHGSSWLIATAGLGLYINGSNSADDPATYYLRNIRFENNQATPHSSTTDNDYGQTQSSAPPALPECSGDECGLSIPSDGGAMRITIVAQAQNAFVQVVNSQFVNNSATNGGAVFIEQQRYIHSSLVAFIECVFERNLAFGSVAVGLAGDCGAIGILSLMTKFNQRVVNGESRDFEDVNYVVLSSVFHHNTAQRNGGGLCLVRLCDFDWEVTETSEARSRFGGAWLLVRNVTFYSNIAGENGAGLYALGSILDGVQPPTVLMDDVLFENNIIQASGVGALFAVKTTVLIRSSGIRMIGNNGSAMYLQSSLVILSSSDNMNNTRFINNTGIDGGAIFLVQPAQIVLDANTSLLFEGNRATDKGGAVFLQAQASTDSKDAHLLNKHCFLQTNFDIHSMPRSSWEISLYFENNQASNGGAAAYLSSVVQCVCIHESCLPPDMNTTNFNMSGDLPTPESFPFLSLIRFRNNSISAGVKGIDNSPYVAIGTDPAAVKVKTTDLRIAPGAFFSLDILVTDQFHIPSWAVLKLVDITPGLPPECKLKFRPSQFQVNQLGANTTVPIDSLVKFSFVAPNLHVYRGVAMRVARDSTDVHCQVQRIISVVGLTDSTPFSADFSLTVASCPPGFTYNKDEMKCLCRTRESRIIQCNDTDQTVVVQQGSWGEVLGEDRTLILYPCPAHFLSPCHTDSTKALTGCPFPVNTSQQCSANRTGSTLCGQCKPGFGLAFQAYNCIECDQHYIARLMWIVFIVLVIACVIVRYNLRIGPKIRGVLFALQNISFYLFELPSNRIYEMGLYISSITNLNFAFGLCVLKQLDALESTFAGYTAPLIVSLVLLAAYFASSQGWMKSLSHESRLNGFLTLMFLAYQSLAFTSLFLLYCQPVTTNLTLSNSSSEYVVTSELTTQVFFLDGTIKCWQGKHLIFGIIAILILAFLVLPVPIITFLVAIGKAPTRLRPFQDVLILGHGFQPRKAWWFSVDLLRRLFVSLLFIFITDYKIRVVSLELAALFLLTIHLYTQPYIERLANVAEALALLDLALVGSLTIQQDERNTPTAVFITFILLPVAYMLIYISLTLWSSFKQWKKQKNKAKQGLLDEIDGDSDTAGGVVSRDSASLGYARPVLRKLHAASDVTGPYAAVRASAIARLPDSDDPDSAAQRSDNTPTHINSGTGNSGAGSNGGGNSTSHSLRRSSKSRRTSWRRKGKPPANGMTADAGSRDEFLSMSVDVDSKREHLSSKNVGTNTCSSRVSMEDRGDRHELRQVRRQLKTPLLGQQTHT